MAVLSCRHFNGYKPCGKNDLCDSRCPSMDPVEEYIVLIHLGALGAVVRSTSLLAPLRRKHPRAHLIWITESWAAPLLEGHPLIDQVIKADFEGLLSVKNFHFNAAYVVDKSAKAAGILSSLHAEKVFGFMSQQGKIIPANPEAEELWKLGLSNENKFFINTKPETQLTAEALVLDYRRDEYNLPLSSFERKLAEGRRKNWSQDGDRMVVGINTGCSPVIPYKKLSTEFQRSLCQRLMEDSRIQVVLLGGPEDTDRNRQISEVLNIISSPTEQGLRDGLVSVAACDMVITGDSLGMHMAISQRKWVAAWFGPTCAHEIDLFGRGVKILSRASCAPCWKRSCQKDVMCYDQVELSEFINGVEKGFKFWQQTSLSKPPFSEMPYSASPY